MKNQIIIATKNKGKVREFEQMFANDGYQVTSLFEYEEIPDIEETGKTFAENAVLKAETLAKALNQKVIADDSGLVIDALDGRPGVYSARYAGEEKSDKANNEKVLNEMKDIPSEDRTARFVCTIAVASPGEPTYVVEGTCEGIIALEPAGANGFGYDPIMFLPGFEKTMAQLSPQEKNQISHRARALEKLMEQWK
ncbi:XTP/dITP diphosphatase [Alkalihalophilus marmarensis]|uniref:dITP/XTP pyrophosphatase n=1 Tax=Alkalihalophilus marmarensis DSM 21297 TaxID=1188261 RepID=U6SM66_9BACI|nr:XTP/dITP diphosphatase [Alkalihalophilus marmarensis]ERN52457.1 deoxyribonucleotide triphosphate pyrophosphatase [Alkalihalophilus marmarensis DSM 21297]MCM3487850.1 XTP/dITP diphosphatase [Alkalihalophilus marmarensis]